MKKTEKRTAAQAYEGNENDIGALLDLLSQEMTMAGEYAKKEGLHWAHVGTLTEVRRKLIETLAFLAQHDEAFIEKHLDEMREEGK